MANMKKILLSRYGACEYCVHSPYRNITSDRPEKCKECRWIGMGHKDDNFQDTLQKTTICKEEDK